MIYLRPSRPCLHCRGEGMNIVTIAAAGIGAVLLALQLKSLRPEYGAYLIVAVCIYIFFYGVTKLETILKALEEMEGLISINRVYLMTLLKMVGITFVAEFASAICKDAGYSALGTQIEIFGKLSILALGTPILLALFETDRKSVV